MGLGKKYLMIHADDAGLSHSQNRATIECLKKGMVNSYSIMVPCSGFEEIAIFAKKYPEYDYGIHLTLTCEWNQSRFGPISPAHTVQSLIDEYGYFHKTREALRKHGDVDDVYVELKAQIEKALDFGLRPSHLDSHMFSVGASASFFNVYRKLGQEFNLPVLINLSLLQMVGLSKEALKKGDFIFEHAHFASFDDFQKGSLEKYYLHIIDNLNEGLNILLIHPAYDDDEMRELTVDHPNFGSVWRQMDFDTFTSKKTQSKLLENNIELVSWKEINLNT